MSREKFEASAESFAPPSTARLWFEGAERRKHRRHDLETSSVMVQRLEEARAKINPTATPLGRLMDISASGVRIRTADKSLQVGTQIRVTLELPDYAGISPFVDTTGPNIRAKRSWTGWINVTRVRTINNELEVGGQLVDLDEIDRGMLSLYLSTQPLAA